MVRAEAGCNGMSNAVANCISFEPHYWRYYSHLFNSPNHFKLRNTSIHKTKNITNKHFKISTKEKFQNNEKNVQNWKQQKKSLPKFEIEIISIAFCLCGFHFCLIKKKSRLSIKAPWFPYSIRHRPSPRPPHPKEP